MATDAELLQRYAETRSDHAFAELVERHVNLVYGSALRQLGGDVHAAEDVTQAVFTSLAQKARALMGRDVIASWLYTSTRFAAAKTRRTLARRLKHETEAEIMHALERNSTATAAGEKLGPLVDEAMHELNERDRGAVLLRFFEGRPFAEIGEAYGLSEDAARMRVERALEKLRTRLARRGVTSTSVALSFALTAQGTAAAPAGLAASVTGAALAAVTGSVATTTAAAAFAFMSTAKIAATMAVAGGLAGIGLGFHGMQRTRAAEEARASSDRERDALRGQLRESAARVADLEARARKAELPRPPEVAAGPRTDARAGIARGQAAPAGSVILDDARAKLAQANQNLKEKMALMADPDVQRTRLEMERLSLGIRYGQFYRNVNLAPDQVARFEARWVESRQEAADIFAAAQANGIAPNDPAIVALANRAKAKYEEDMRAILGEAGFGEFERYDRTYPARETVTGLLGNLAFAGAPLTRDQVNQLTLTIAAQSAGYQKGERVAERAQDVDWPAALRQAQPFLSPQQFEALRVHAAHAQASQHATELINLVSKPRAAQAEPTAPRKPAGG